MQIDKARLVVVNNSTVGFEVITRKKNLMVLGDSYYDKYKYLIAKHNKTDETLVLFLV